MASTTATMKYASRSAVSGSNAYDLKRIANDGYKEAAAMPRVLEKPSVKSAQTVKTSAHVQKEAEARPVARNHKKAQKAYGLSLFAIAGFAVVVVMMVFVLLAHVKYSEVTNETVQLQMKLDQLTEDERKLKIAYGDAFDAGKVEKYATNVLGMTKATDAQIASVDSSASDKAEVLGTRQNSQSEESGVGTFLMSLVAYFK